MKILKRLFPFRAAKPESKKKAQKPKSPDRVSISQERWYTPAVNLAKSLGVSALVGAGLATAGLVGGLPAVGLAAVTGAVAGGSVPARFSGWNALGTFTSFGSAALLGMTGPAGIVGGAALGVGLCLNAMICTNQTKFG